MNISRNCGLDWANVGLGGTVESCCVFVYFMLRHGRRRHKTVSGRTELCVCVCVCVCVCGGGGVKDKRNFNVKRYGCGLLVLVRFKEGLDLAGRVGCVVWESCGMLEYGRDGRVGMWRSEVYPFRINATAI